MSGLATIVACSIPATTTATGLSRIRTFSGLMLSHTASQKKGETHEMAVFSAVEAVATTSTASTTLSRHGTFVGLRHNQPYRTTISEES